MALLTAKLRAATLTESLVAMIVIMLSFGIATVVFTNVTRSSALPLQIKAQTVLRELALQSKTEKLFLDASFTYGGLVITKKVAPYGGSKQLSLLNLEANDPNGKKVGEYNELVMTE